MKSLLFTALLSTGVAHTGAFLSVWELPHVEDHFTIQDLGRKLNNVTKWKEKSNAHRDRLEKTTEEHYAMYDRRPDDLSVALNVSESKPGAKRTLARPRMRTRGNTVR